MAESLQIIDLPSDPLARGRAHGEALRDQIHQNFGIQAESILASPATAARSVRSIDDYLAFARKHQDVTSAFNPSLWEEATGIAQGSGLTIDHILAMNLHLEFIDLANRNAPDPVADGGCTTFGAMRTDGQGCVLGQTYDLNNYYEDAAFVFRTETNGLTIRALSFAGTLAATGINSAGFAVVINKLYGKDARVGVPYPFLLRAALEQPTPGRSLSVIMGARRGGSLNYLCADGAGLLYPVETSAAEWDLLQPDDGVFVHTNHFLSPYLKRHECRDMRVYNAHTIVRYQRARQILRGLGPDATLNDYQNLMSDKHNYPLSINCHDDEQVKVKTVACALYDTADGTAMFGKGNLTDNPLVTVDPSEDHTLAKVG